MASGPHSAVPQSANTRIGAQQQGFGMVRVVCFIERQAQSKVVVPPSVCVLLSFVRGPWLGGDPAAARVHVGAFSLLPM